MEHKSPASFPRRVKRYQSYSMTPMDFQLDSQTDLSNSSFTPTDKFKLTASSRLTTQIAGRCSQIPDTNQFTLKQDIKICSPNGFSFQNSQKTYGQLRNQQKSKTQMSSYAFRQQNNKKLANSEIFSLSSIAEKSSPKIVRLMRKSTFLPNQTQSYGMDYLQNQGSNEKPYRRQKQFHIPSFLLNKKKPGYNGETALTNQFNSKNADQNISSAQNLGFQVEKKRSFTKNKLVNYSKINENENQESIFSPPLNSKISFSKGTSSTLCTLLPREQSRRTFKDFQDLQSLKQIQNSMEDSDNINKLQNQVQSLFRKEQNPTKQVHHLLENQIAELFSDQEDDESEEFNEDLKDELQQLF